MSSLPYEIIKGGGHVSLGVALSTEQIYLAQNRAPLYGRKEGRRGIKVKEGKKVNRGRKEQANK